MNAADFITAAHALQLANGLTEEAALAYMARIGDTPELAADGKVIVRDDAGQEITRLIFPDDQDDAQ